MDGLSSICAGLGSLEEDDDGNRIGYTKGEYCSDNVKDLLRFLRRDDPEKRDVFKQVCKWNIVGKDVLPIIEYYQEDRSLVLNAVKILVFLTMPVEPTSFDIPQQIEYLWELKAAITMSSVVPVIVSLLESPLENLENECFTDDDWKLVQLVLTLFRNVLAIQDILPNQQAAGGSATQFLYLRDKFLELLFKENVMDLILVLSQNTGGDSHGYLRQDNILLLEFFYYIFKGQDPEMIVKSYLKGSKGSKVEEDSKNIITSLQAITQEEIEKRKLIRTRNISRHSQFSGTFTRMALDGSKTLFKGNPSASGDVLLKSHKKQRGRSKRITWDQGEKPSTRTQTLELFYGFITQFLVGGYNALMQSILEDIEKDQEQIQSSDIVIFFNVAQFVMSFQYHKCLTSKPTIDIEKESVTQNDDYNDTLFSGSICGPVSETLNESMFKMVISKWHYAFEELKQSNDYKFLSAAGSVVKVMIRMLDLVLKQAPEDSKEPQTARVLLYKLFYDQTEEGMVRFILNLIKSFDTHKQSKSDLAELVESMHVILRLIESLQARGTLRVSRKSRKKKKKKSMTKDEHVKEIGGSISVDNNTNTHNVVGDSSADVNMSEKETTNQEFDESLKDSVLFDGPVEAAKLASNDEPDVMTDDVARAYLGSDNSSGDDEQPLLTDEVDFKVSSLVAALANNTIIHNLCWLLKFYKSNSFTTNHYIICMFRRICEDLELSPMLYQLSHLTIFYEILNEQKLRPSKDYENIVIFLKSLVRRMLRKMKSYPFLLVEVLFSKNRQECHYINCGYMINDLKNMRSGCGSGGRDFSEGDTWAPRSVADALGDDDFEDFLKDDQENNYPGDGNESSESIPDDEIDGIINDRTGHIDEEGPDIMFELTLNNEMQDRLKDLYEKYKNDPDFAELIGKDLDQNGNISKMQVSKALKQLGVKIPAKRKLRKSGVSNRLSNEEVSMADLQNKLKESKLPKKGVNVFTVDQEQKIRDLFMQFQEQKRCSHMIAKELDSTGKISANIISRKLKQLGLVVPKRKKGAGDNKASPEITGESDDDKTLFSLSKRGRHKWNGIDTDKKINQRAARKSPEDMSDDEPLSALVGKHKRNGIDTDKKINQKVARKSPEDMTDDEPLSALVKSKKKPRRSEDDELMVDSTERNPAENNSNGSDTQVSARDEYIQAIEIHGVFEEETPIVSHSSDTETQTMRRDTPNASSEEEAVNSEHEPVFDDLAGHRQTQTMRADSPPNVSSNEVVTTEHEPPFDDELTDQMADFYENRNDSSTTTEKNSVPRRRLRMVLDFDDDEE